MRYPMTIALLLCVCAVMPAVAGGPDEPPLDCSHRSLAHAVATARDRNPVIRFTGVCQAPIVIETEGLTLEGVGAATIDGDGQDAVTVAGAGRVTLRAFDVRGGVNGVVARNGAHLTATDLNVHDNTATGIVLHTGTTAVLTNVTVAENGTHGLEAHTGAAATVHGTLNATGNAVFGINVNGSAFTLSQATVTATGNAVGIQISTGAHAFIGDPDSTITANNNLATGLTVVSGAQLVSFGGDINASGNAGIGVSVSSKAGVDLDAGAVLTSVGNGDGLLVQTSSVMSVFNTPQFSGVPGFSTIVTRNNTRTGIRVLSDARLTLVNQARVESTQNGTVGFTGDNGAGITLVNSTITGNTAGDLVLTFGARADLRTLTFGTHTCDATVLVRGTSGITCP